MKHRPALGLVDLRAREHRLAPGGHLRATGKLEQERHRLRVEMRLGIVEKHPARAAGVHLRAVRVVEQIEGCGGLRCARDGRAARRTGSSQSLRPVDRGLPQNAGDRRLDRLELRRPLHRLPLLGAGDQHMRADRALQNGGPSASRAALRPPRPASPSAAARRRRARRQGCPHRERGSPCACQCPCQGAGPRSEDAAPSPSASASRCPSGASAGA